MKMMVPKGFNGLRDGFMAVLRRGWPGGLWTVKRGESQGQVGGYDDTGSGDEQDGMADIG